MSVLLKDTKNRPDLTVKYLKNNPHLWINSTYAQLVFSEALHKIGAYKESMGFGFCLSVKNLKPYHQTKNYFILAQNYAALKNISKTRYYLDRAITGNNQYYYFYYARFEEFQHNYLKALELYNVATGLTFRRKDYILRAYSRALCSALLYYKNRNHEIYADIYQQILLHPDIPKTKAYIINRSVKL